MKFYRMFRVELLRLFEVKKICFTLSVSLFILYISLTGYFKNFSIQFADVYQVLSTLFGGDYYIELLLLPVGYFIVMDGRDIIGTNQKKPSKIKGLQMI